MRAQTVGRFLFAMFAAAVIASMFAVKSHAIYTRRLEEFGIQTHAEWTGSRGTTYTVTGMLMDYEVYTVGGQGVFTFTASTQVTSLNFDPQVSASTAATPVIISSFTTSFNGIPYHEDMRAIILNPAIVVQSLPAGATMTIDMTYLIPKNVGEF